MRLFLYSLLVSGFVASSSAFLLAPTSSTSRPVSRRKTHCAMAQYTNDNKEDSMFGLGRRGFLHSAVASAVLCLVTTPSFSNPASAADNYAKGTVWLTGKYPQVPGQKPHDKKDVKGTRKDANFLRSISDCKAQCERSTGPDGLARSKEDCLSECQDVCCDSYEQCTFAIVPRI